MSTFFLNVQLILREQNEHCILILLTHVYFVFDHLISKTQNTADEISGGRGSFVLSSYNFLFLIASFKTCCPEILF